ncbi:MAG: glycoside hydrolase 43 family protein [Clostridiales bacterium]|nr:glycoside hydrolase 43 family protein [Clostridiales bacterium]
MSEKVPYTPAWGDQGNGTYKNPVLFADYSDPDVIRVGGDYYMVCSEFHFMGMPLLHSADLVNWTIINRLYDRLLPGTDYDHLMKYGAGSWAPSIRHHNGTFHVYFCTPDEGLFMMQAKDPEGKWSEPKCIRPAYRWEDPCPFWDEDGQAYLGRSQWGAGPIFIHRMSPDGAKLLDDGTEVYSGPVAEGTKIYKKDGYYYLVIPEGSVPTGWQTALRARSIYGPYEKQVVISQGDTWVNGPHQGALVDTPEGELWFMHFSSTGVAGRVCHLQPAGWADGWPVIGRTDEPDALCGRPVLQYAKPKTKKACASCAPQTSDSFASDTLSPQWQWNHNPVDGDWSLTERRGWLRLKSRPVEGDALHIRNVLTQKLTGASGLICVKLSLKHMVDFQTAGLMLLGKTPVFIGASKMNGRPFIATHTSSLLRGGAEIAAEEVILRIGIQYLTQVTFSYSTDNGKTFSFLPSGALSEGVWKGARVALFTRDGVGGTADFCDFRYIHDGPGGLSG